MGHFNMVENVIDWKAKGYLNNNQGNKIKPERLHLFLQDGRQQNKLKTEYSVRDETTKE